MRWTFVITVYGVVYVQGEDIKHGLIHPFKRTGLTLGSEGGERTQVKLIPGVYISC